MNRETDQLAWPPVEFVSQLQKAGVEFTEQQMQLFERMMMAGAGQSRNGTAGNGLGDIGAMSMETAMFKTRVQSGGRISIPDAEREALDIDDGDLVQAFVVPLKAADGGTDDE